MSGKLIVCGTPIGNLEDMTQRAIRVLQEADVIACEDTRRTRKLLSHFGIPTPKMLVYHEGNERDEASAIATLVASGKTVVLVSDAGMPGLSDPGYHLVRACIEREQKIEVVPGPSAVVAAVVVSGLPPARFVFEGFIPRRAGDRRARFEDLAEEPRTLVFYESPHRIAASLEDAQAVLGDRPAAIARELTKMHEEVRRGPLSELIEWANSAPPKGEIVVIIAGAAGDKEEIAPAELAEKARKLMSSGMARREALTEVARSSGVPRRKVFDALVEGDEGSS
jgi:16S rRNA (cytidine1402-2'-O)-methyltransferase